MAATAGIKFFWGGDIEYPSGIEVDSQDNVFVVGFLAECDDPSSLYYSTARIGDNNGVDYTSPNTPTACQRTFLAKFNTNGVFQWIHYPYAPIANYPWANHPFSSRNFYIINDVIHWVCSIPPGTYEGGAFSNTNTSLPFLYYLLKYDTSGAFISATPFDLELSNFTSAELRWYRNPYNGYYYAIYLNDSSNNITVIANGNNLNYTLPKIICFNEQGQYQWHREPSGDQIKFDGLTFDNNNNIYLTGIANNFIVHSFLSWNLPGSNTGFASFIMKCNPDITSYSWVTHHSQGSANANNALFYTSSSIYFGGAINQNPLSWNGQTIAGPGANNDADPLLARFDPATGACLGLQRLVGTNGYGDAFTNIVQDAAGDLLLGGYMGLDLTDSNGVQHFTAGGNSDFFVTKYATQACQPLSNESFENESIKVYPNPVKEKLQVVIKENMSYTLYNLLGTVIQKGKLTPQENSINTISLQPGCYVLQLTNGQGNVLQLKMVKE